MERAAELAGTSGDRISKTSVKTPHCDSSTAIVVTSAWHVPLIEHPPSGSWCEPLWLPWCMGHAVPWAARIGHALATAWRWQPCFALSAG